MKAAVLTRINEPLEIIENIEVPELSGGQILVELAYSGVCHSQLMESRGGRGHDPYLPHLLGHEGTGIVRKTGSDVKKVQVGDKVILTWVKGSGREAGGSQYSHGTQKINSGGVTTFNEFSVISENRCVKLPDGIPMDIGILFGCALLTGAGAVINTLKPRSGSTVGVFGLGGVGLSALMATQIFGCQKVIAVDVEEEKLRLALEMGATHVVNSKKESPVDAIYKITEGKGLDYALEAAGLSSTIEQAFAAVRKKGGLCVFASHPKSGEKISIDPYDLISGKQILGTWGGESNPDRDIPLIADLYLKGKMPLEKLLSKKTYSLMQVNDALDDLHNRVVTRPLIAINPELGM